MRACSPWAGVTRITVRVPLARLAPLLAVLLAMLLGGCAAAAPTVTVVATPTPSATATLAPTATPVPAASIAGHLGYPASLIPPLTIYALSTSDPSVHYHIDTAQNQFSYSITGVAPGTYHVIAYLKPDKPALRGGYSQFVLCGLAASCPSHALVDVVVQPGVPVSGIDPTDWYAPEGTFPAPPSA
jgi:hypothetical protein